MMFSHPYRFAAAVIVTYLVMGVALYLAVVAS